MAVLVTIDGNFIWNFDGSFNWNFDWNFDGSRPRMESLLLSSHSELPLVQQAGHIPGRRGEEEDDQDDNRDDDN